MGNGVASLPNLSTIEEEPSVLHDDSPLRLTLQEPSSSHETAKSPEEEPSMENDAASLANLSTIEEEPSVLHDDSPLRQTSQEPSQLKDKKKNHPWKMVWPA